MSNWSELEELAKKATPGPWHWNMNLGAKCVRLDGARNIVMDFWRWGMNRAAPVFCKQNPSILQRADTFAKVVPGREHHADWYQDIDHPDAQFIAAANPATILALLAALREEREDARRPEPLKLWYMRDNHTFRELPLDVEQAMAAIEKELADGHTSGMLCSKQFAPNEHANYDDLPGFRKRARKWLAAALAAQKGQT